MAEFKDSSGTLHTQLPFGMLCMAPRGGGWAGENHKHVRRERGAVTRIRTPNFPYQTELRVQFRDGSCHWVPITVVSWCGINEAPFPPRAHAMLSAREGR